MNFEKKGKHNATPHLKLKSAEISPVVITLREIESKDYQSRAGETQGA